MKPKTVKHRVPREKHVLRNGRRMVMLEESEYNRLRMKADEWEPLLPEPDSDGNYPAVAYARVSLARVIIRHRRRLGLTQVDLARRAGIRPETLCRIELGNRTPALGTVQKIDRALKRAEAEIGRLEHGVYS
jgi:DNA-binding XRE family transcriptional regulator